MCFVISNFLKQLLTKASRNTVNTKDVPGAWDPLTHSPKILPSKTHCTVARAKMSPGDTLQHYCHLYVATENVQTKITTR